MRYTTLRNLPSETMTLSRKKPGVIQGPVDKLIIRQDTRSPREINLLRDLADGRIVQVF